MVNKICYGGELELEIYQQKFWMVWNYLLSDDHTEVDEISVYDGFCHPYTERFRGKK